MLLFLRNDVSKSKEKEQLTKIQKNELCLNNILSKTSTFTFIWLSAIRVRVKNPVTETFHSGGGGGGQKKREKRVEVLCVQENFLWTLS